MVNWQLIFCILIQNGINQPFDNCKDLLVEDIFPTNNSFVYALKLSTTNDIDWIKFLDIDRNMIVDGQDVNLLPFTIKPYSFMGAMIEIINDNQYSTD